MYIIQLNIHVKFIVWEGGNGGLLPWKSRQEGSGA